MEEAVKSERRRAAAAAAAADGVPRRPLAPSEKNNAVPAGRRSEGASRFKPVAPPSPAAPAARRCSSPSPGRASAADGSATATATCNNRARSADRARPAAASSSAPSSSQLKPSTTGRSAIAMPPPRDAAADAHRHSTGTPPRARNGSKAAGGLWAPSARSSSPLLRSSEPVQVQSPVSKVDRLVRGLPSSEQVVQLRSGAVVAESSKRSPRRRGSSNNTIGDHQCENARPSTSNSNSVAEKHRWPWPGMMTMTSPGRGSAGAAGLTSSDASATGRSPSRTTTHPSEGTLVKSLLKRASNEMAKIVHRRRKDKPDSSTSSDTSSQTSESSKSTCRRTKAAVSSSSPAPFLHRSPSPRQQRLSPAASSSASSSRSCQSPSRMRPCQSKCAASAASQSVVEQPVFNYIVDAPKGKKNAGQIESIHQLRLLSNRYLQWRFVNARSEETLSHKNSVESILYGVWKTVLTLQDALTIKRTNVRHLQQELKLYDILTEQIGYLEQWPEVEEECNDTLVDAMEALKATTLRLPVTSGAQADGIAVRNAISSAVDVMQALSSSIDYVQSKVQDRTSLVSELSVTARQEKLALDQCRDLLAKAAKLQVQETSLRTLLMQLRQRSAGAG